MDRVKVCPVCHSEYYPDVQVCADCGVSLEWAQTQQDIEPLVDGGGWDQFEPTEIIGQLTADLEKVTGIYRANLVKAGIPSAQLPLTRYLRPMSGRDSSPMSGNSALNPQGRQVPVGDLLGGFHFILFVRRGDLEVADGIISELFAGLHPHQEDGSYQEFTEGACPACGAEIHADATECPDCGLPFTEPS